MSAHRFRFFAHCPLEEGVVLQLGKGDTRHLKVIRARSDAAVDVVDERGWLFAATVAGERELQVGELVSSDPEPLPQVTLYAGVLTGNSWDELIDGAVQAGVSRIVPVVTSAKAQEQVDRRLERAQRIAESAAKQAKRLRIPEVAPALEVRALTDRNHGIVLDPGADVNVAAVAAESSGPVNLLVGGSEGLPDDLVTRLTDAGWIAATLGPTVLRSELAAPVAVSTVVQCVPGG